MALAMTGLVSGCAVGPDFLHPGAPEVSRYTKEPLASRTASADVSKGNANHFVNGKDIPAEWWRLYRSQPLNTLVGRSIDANPNLQAALAALRIAKENTYAQQGSIFPRFRRISIRCVKSRPPSLHRRSRRTPVYSVSTPPSSPSPTHSTYGVKIGAQSNSLQATADLQRFQVEAAYLTLTANVVVAAIEEASLRGQIEATNKLIDINSKALEILRKQFDEGYANRNDVAAQEAALAQVRATLPPLRKQLAINRNLLAALSGHYPSQEPSETFRLSDLRLPTNLPLSLPAQLVQQRPDVRAAEELLHAASAQIGVSIASMLPNLTLSGNRGYTAAEISSLFTGPAIFWTVAGNATAPLFDGFTLLHEERAAQAAYEQAAWNYRTTVITAFQQVADALRAIQNDADAVKAASDFEKASKISLDLAQQQMQMGNANILYLLTAQTNYEQAVIQLVQTQANRVSDTAALFQALGGGWWNWPEPPAPELKLDVATGHSQPVPEAGNWLTTALGNVRWNPPDMPWRQPKSEVANAAESQPAPEAGNWLNAALDKVRWNPPAMPWRQPKSEVADFGTAGAAAGRRREPVGRDAPVAAVQHRGKSNSGWNRGRGRRRS